MAPVAWVLVGLDVAIFAAVGWPADALARNPGGRAGVGWFALTFGFPALVWVVIATIGGSDYDAGDLLYFLGYLVSVVAIVAGTFVSRAVRDHRR
jgi:hypothetical protein